MAKANTLVGFWFAVKRDLNVEAEVDYIAIFYDVLFTFKRHLPASLAPDSPLNWM